MEIETQLIIDNELGLDFHFLASPMILVHRTTALRHLRRLPAIRKMENSNAKYRYSQYLRNTGGHPGYPWWPRPGLVDILGRLARTTSALYIGLG